METHKDLIDFLWDWAEENGNWAKLLVKYVVEMGNTLSTDQRKGVFESFLQSISLKKSLPAISITKPVYNPTAKRVDLLTLSDVLGVNKLAEGQIINFAENLTVIYGENGTGKTGYGRILKSLGYGYDLKKRILPNIYSTNITKASAKIKFKVDGIEKSFDWNDIVDNPDLKNISVFNNNCVDISLSDKNRAFIVSPIGFRLFEIMKNELYELNNILQKVIGSHPVDFQYIGQLHSATPQIKFIKELTGKTDETEILKFSSYNPDKEKELLKKEAELKNLNKPLIENEIKSLGLILDELASTKKKIEKAKDSLNNDIWNKLLSINKQIKQLAVASRKGINEIAKTYGIQFFQSTEFEKFLDSAEKYIKILNATDYPLANTDVCIYCHQPLNDSARSLISSYREILNDTTQRKID